MIRRTAITLAGALIALAGIPALASAATRTVCASGCDYTTIQAAVDAAADGDVIEVGGGTYAGATINTRVTIQGEGIAATTVQAATAFTLQAGGSGSTLRDMTVRGTTATGTSYGITAATGAVDDITLANLTVTNARWAIDVRNTASADGWTIENVTATGNNFGARFWGHTTNLVIENSHFDRNDYGLYSQYTSRSGNVGVPSVFDGIDVDSTTFNENSTKGIYLEAVSDAVFSDVEIDGSGTIAEIRPSGQENYPRAGVDINVKYGGFANVAFIDTRVTNTLGTAMAIKGRDDAENGYDVVPATLTGVTLSGMTITGTRPTAHPEALGHGIAFGYNVIDAHITGSRIVGNEGGGILSYVTSGSTIDATNNWWGCNGGPGAAGCDSATVAPDGAPITTDPRVVLGVSTPGGVPVGGAVPVTASIATNSAGGPVVGLPEQEIGLSTTFGELSTSGGLTSGGVLSSTFTGWYAGFATIAATLDNQTTTVGVNVFVPLRPTPEPELTPMPVPVLTTPPPPGASGDEPSTSPPAERAEEQASQILGGDVRSAGFRLRGLAEVFRPAASRIEIPRSRRTPVLAVGCEAVQCQVAVKIVLRLRDGTRIVLPVQRSSASQGEAVPVTLRLTAKQRRQIRRAGGATMSVEVRVSGNGERATSRRDVRVR